MNSPGRILLWIAAAVLVGASGPFLPEFYITLLNYIGLYALVALGLVVLTGVSGITSFGQAAFVGIGAYTTTVMTVTFGQSPWLGLVAGLIVSFALALVLGAITLRLSGHYLPLGTICWSVSLYYIFGNMAELGGQLGVNGIPPIKIFGWALDTGRSMYYLIWICTLGAMLLTDNVLRSRVGRAMRALKYNGEMAESFGVNGSRMKLLVFVYAAVLAALSGWLYAHLLRFVNPTPFGINMSIEYLFMAVVGGAGYVWGAVLGSAVITILKELLQDILPNILGRSGNFEIIAFGALIIMLLQLNQDKGFGLLFQLFDRKTAGSADGKNLPKPVHVKPAGPLLTAQTVTRAFGGLVAVNKVTFDVKPASIVAVIGPNGAGKSTLFSLLTRLLDLNEGEVHFEAQRIDRLAPHELVRLGISRSYQHVRLVPDRTVLENVMLGGHSRTSRGALSAAVGLGYEQELQLQGEAEAQLDRLGLLAYKDELAGNLSLGQQRLVEIARALASAPKLLLLDEPAAGLRHHEKEDLAKLLGELRREGMTILLVEHDMRFVMTLANNIVVLNFGKMLAEGGPREVRANPMVLEAYLGKGR
jgi:branched-chain amino acid transport system permease protein